FVIWAIIDGLLLVAILCGNILTILAVRFSRRLRSVISNHFVLSLAISDILVGLTLPYHLTFYLGSELGSSKHWCLLRFFFVIMACCVSIWNLIAIALDRYIAICYPLHYSRYMTRKIALCLMAFGWIVGLTIAAIPLIWNKWEHAQECEFDQIFYPWYMVGVITPVFSLVWLCMLFVYCRIWREASKQVKQLRTTGQQEGTSDWKSVQMVLLILGCFTICWLPYFIVACSQIYRIIESSSAVAYMAAFTLAMSNSAMNPLIYAWKNSNFRQAFCNLLKCKSPDTLEPSQSMRSNLHRKSSSAQHQDTISGAFPNYSTPPFMQRKIEPIHAMGITFEEDEDKISTHEGFETKVNRCNDMTNVSSNPPPPVTIKIESDMKNSIVISTTTLPTLQDDETLTTIITNGDTKTQNENDGKTVKTGNLIVNQLMENYGYDASDDDIKKFKENSLNINFCSTMNGQSKIKSRSANSIAITRSPNKSNSHGAIFDFSHSKYRMNEKVNDSNNDTNSEGKSVNKNLFPAFNFRRKYISKSFNTSKSTAQGLDKSNGSCDNSNRKSVELNYNA
ncbi:CLUMA_CG004410, isoform A, partial [Clunio marinus]